MMKWLAMTIALGITGSAQAAEHKVTGFAINEVATFCRGIMKYLGAPPGLDTTLQLPPATDFPDFVLPKWTDLDPNTHADILKRIFMRVGPGAGQTISDAQWKSDHLPKLQAAMKRAGSKLQAAHVDLDNDGTAEDIYRLNLEVHDAYPASRSLINLEPGTMAWLLDIAPTADAALVEGWPTTGNVPTDVFSYKDKTRVMVWDYKDQKRALSVATLAKDRPEPDKPFKVYQKYECGLNEVMK